MEKAVIDKVKVYHKPRLLSDNGLAYQSAKLAQFLNERRIKHIHRAPYHPMTQGKIERWHCSMKNMIKQQNYYSPSELERAIAEWVAYYNNQRYHESLENGTPADVYFGREKEIIEKKINAKKKPRLYVASNICNSWVNNPINKAKSLHKESGTCVQNL
jgi:putative transposase